MLLIANLIIQQSVVNSLGYVGAPTHPLVAPDWLIAYDNFWFGGVYRLSGKNFPILLNIHTKKKITRYDSNSHLHLLATFVLHRFQASSGNYHHHAARRFRVRPDIIDRLDDVSLQYHHEGPYESMMLPAPTGITAANSTLSPL
jgi:hypothetical protein